MPTLASLATPSKLPGVPEARAHPVLRRYPLRRLKLPVGAGQVSVVVPDERAWMREGTWAFDVVRGKEPPYWVRIWPAALAAARALALAGPLDGLRVLDLGCGLGLPGVQAAAAGARVTFADQAPDATSFACWNAKAQPGSGEVEALTLDWARATVEGAFDLILLSDVSYRALHHGPLRRHLAECLAPHGVALHADPHRELATRFLTEIAGGYARKEWSRPTIIQDRRADVRLTLLTKSGHVASLPPWFTGWWARCEAARGVRNS